MKRGRRPQMPREMRWRDREYVVPRVVGEKSAGEFPYRKCAVRQYSDHMRKNPTPSERRFAQILKALNHGVLRGQFQQQHIVSGDFIVDFYFPSIRLAIEIDGSFHDELTQQMRDEQKGQYCARMDITLLRLRNHEVWGEHEHLVERLREGWRAALRRKNRIIGKVYGEVEM